MRTTFHPFLPNGPTGDPLLWINVPDEGHALMIDLGDIRHISNRSLLRVDRIVVTHAHMDHFVGFDPWLRMLLAHDHEPVISGPAGFIDRVRGKLAGYDWNLIRSYPVRFVVEEITASGVRAVRFRGCNGLRPEPAGHRAPGTLHAHRAYTVEVGLFDHGIPVLGVALHETDHLAVDAARLRQLGLQPAPWLGELKNAVRRRADVDGTIDALRRDGSRQSWRIGPLSQQLLQRRKGQKLAYLTDLNGSAQNLDRARALVAGADLLVCEAAFLHCDHDLARTRNHLTAQQAGRLAREAGVQRLAPFHFSARYHGREQELLDEASRAFGGEVVELPAGPHGSPGR